MKRLGWTLGATYDWGFGISMALALMVPLLGGELPTWTWLALPVAGAGFWLRSLNSVPRGAFGTVVGSFGIFVASTVLADRGLDAALLAAAHALIWILAGRILSRDNLSHDTQALLLSLALVFSGAGLHTQLTFAPLLLGYTLAVVWTLLGRELIRTAARTRERDDDNRLQVARSRRDVAGKGLLATVLIVACSILVLMSSTFLLFPRIGFRNLGLFARNAVGFPDEVSLEGTPRAGAGGPVMVRLSGIDWESFSDGLYLRGPVYDRFTVRGFVRSDVPQSMPPSRMAPGRAETRTYEIFSRPLTGRILLSLGRVERARVLGGGRANPSYKVGILGQGPSGELLASGPLEAPIRYTVKGAGEVGQGGNAGEGAGGDPKGVQVEAHHLEVPLDLDSRVRGLVFRAGAGARTRFEIIERLSDFLRKNYRYSLAQPNGGASDPLASFLFDHPRGHCEYFATALAGMGRVAGVPTRVVGGFQGGVWDADAGVAVFRTEHAHAWVEWMAEGVDGKPGGWWRADATPPREAPPTLSGWASVMELAQRFWDDNILDYGLTQQLELVRDAQTSLLPTFRIPSKEAIWRWTIGAAALALLIGLLWRFSRRNRRGSTEAMLAALESWLRAAGSAPKDSSTIRECLASHASAPQVVWRGLELYEEARFGGNRRHPPDAQQVTRAIRRLVALATVGTNKESVDD